MKCLVHSKVKGPASAEMHISELLCIRDTALNIKNMFIFIVYSALLTCNHFLLSRTADIKHTFIQHVIRKRHRQLIHTQHLSGSDTLLCVTDVSFCRTACGCYCECNSGLYWRASSVQVYYSRVLCGVIKEHLPVFSLISQSTLNRAGFILWQLSPCFLSRKNRKDTE